MAEGNGRYRVGFDIGGTFTDFVLYDADDRLLLCNIIALVILSQLKTKKKPAE